MGVSMCVCVGVCCAKKPYLTTLSHAPHLRLCACCHTLIAVRCVTYYTHNTPNTIQPDLLEKHPSPSSAEMLWWVANHYTHQSDMTATFFDKCHVNKGGSLHSGGNIYLPARCKYEISVPSIALASFHARFHSFYQHFPTLSYRVLSSTIA